MMTYLAQIPGAEEVIKSAVASGRGYEAILLVIIILSGITLVGFLIKMWVTKSSEREDRILAQAVDREIRLSGRVTTLEDFVKTSMLTALTEVTKANITMGMAATEQGKAINDLTTAFREALHELSQKLASLGESLLRLEKQMADHDANVEHNVERAVSGYAQRLEKEQQVRKEQT